ncbi:MAG: Holliday junction resolvase Hjc [archaeon]
MAYKKGYAFERELRLKLEKDGWHVIRSGGSKKPDLVAGKDKKVIIIECKVTKSDKIYLEKEEVLYLQEVAKAFGAEAMYAIKRKNNGMSLVTLSTLRETEKFFMVEL